MEDDLSIRIKNILFLKNKINELFDKINYKNYSEKDIKELKSFYLKCDWELKELLNIIIEKFNDKNFHI
jgi:hypothetical protein